MTIGDLLSEHNIPHVGAEHRHGRPGWIQIDCPWCGPGSGKFHLGISLSTGASSCWRCGRHSTLRVLNAVTNTPYKTLAAQLEGVVREFAPERKPGKLIIPLGIGPLLEGHRYYLEQRGFDPERIEKLWEISGIGNYYKLPWRIYIPIHYHGMQVSWTTRSVRPNEERRYVSAGAEEESMRHKDILYGADYAHHAIIIHEGPLDAWATGPGAVATCGTSYTEAQVKAMSRYPVRVVCFDSEPVAQARARALATDLSAYPGTTHNVTLESGKDSAEARPEEIAELRKTFLE